MAKHKYNFNVASGDKATPEEVADAKRFQQERDDKIRNAPRKEKKAPDHSLVTFNPFEDRVLVYPDPIEEVTKSGIIKPSEATDKEKPLVGTVIRFGPGKDKPLPLDYGMRVLYGNYAGTDVEFKQLPGVKYLVMRINDIFGQE